MRGFRAAVVARVEAAFLRLDFVFQKQDFVDNRNAMVHLDLHERLADGLADVRGMHSLTPQNDTQANDGCKVVII